MRKLVYVFWRWCRDSYQMTYGSYERPHCVDWTQRKKICKSVTWWRARAKQIFFSNRSIAPPREWIYLIFLPNINDVVYDSYMTSFVMTHSLWVIKSLFSRFKYQNLKNQLPHSQIPMLWLITYDSYHMTHEIWVIVYDAWIMTHR